MSLLARTCSMISRVTLARTPAMLGSVRFSSEVHGDGKKPNESWDEFDKRYIGYFKDPNLDGWWLRKRLQDMNGEDCVPDPKVAAEVLKACRRLNDLALAIRFLEVCRFKAGPKVNSIWPYFMQEITPTLTELGVPSLEELGYTKPELACQEVHDIH